MSITSSTGLTCGLKESHFMTKRRGRGWIIDFFLPTLEPGADRAGGPGGWKGGEQRAESSVEREGGDRNQGFKWSSRVKLGSFTDTRSIPEHNSPWNGDFRTNDATSSQVMTPVWRQNVRKMLFRVVYYCELVVDALFECVIIWFEWDQFRFLRSCRHWPAPGTASPALCGRGWRETQQSVKGRAERSGERDRGGIREWSSPPSLARCPVTTQWWRGDIWEAL